MIRGLLFDLDGVITDTAFYHYKAWKKLTDELDIPFDEEVNEKLKGISREESLLIIMENAGFEGEYSDEQLFKFLDRKNRYYKAMIKEVTPKDILPGMKVVLEQARQLGLKIALASASENAPILLEKLNLTDYFHAVVDPTSLIHGKPAPEIFLRAAEEIGCLPEECVGFEDAQAGVDALLAANIFAVAIGDTELLREANLVYSTTREIDLNEVLRLALGNIKIEAN